MLTLSDNLSGTHKDQCFSCFLIVLTTRGMPLHSIYSDLYYLFNIAQPNMDLFTQEELCPNPSQNILNLD